MDTDNDVTLVSGVDMQEETSRKRQRTSSKNSTAIGELALSRDPKYYMDDADCVIRVEQTLFKVHSFLLSRDSSIFHVMFSIPPTNRDNLSAEGASDEKPVVLTGDTADDFRALLWVLYALPHELEQVHSVDVDIPHLLTIAKITHKYQLTSLSSWAIRAVYKALCGAYVKPEWSLTGSSPIILHKVLETAILCGHRDLCRLVVTSWAQQILETGYGGDETIALHVGEIHGISELQGAAYYCRLRRVGGDMFSGEPLDEAFGIDITAVQHNRLMRGYVSMVAHWDFLSVTPLTFKRPEACAVNHHSSKCLHIWKKRWLRAGYSAFRSKCPTVDVLGRLQHMKIALMSDKNWGGVESSVPEDCKVAALAAVDTKIEYFVNSLMTYFTDPDGFDEE